MGASDLTPFLIGIHSHTLTAQQEEIPIGIGNSIPNGRRIRRVPR